MWESVSPIRFRVAALPLPEESEQIQLRFLVLCDELIGEILAQLIS